MEKVEPRRELNEALKTDIRAAYTRLQDNIPGFSTRRSQSQMIGVASPDPYTTQVYDQINLILMAIAMAGDTSGTAIKDAVRKISQAQGGAKVDNAIDGLKAIAAKQPVDYDGASGPCDFTETGDIADCQFRYEQVQGGKLALVKIA